MPGCISHLPTPRPSAGPWPLAPAGFLELTKAPEHTMGSVGCHVEQEAELAALPLSSV